MAGGCFEGGEDVIPRWGIEIEQVVDWAQEGLGSVVAHSIQIPVLHGISQICASGTSGMYLGNLIGVIGDLLRVRGKIYPYSQDFQLLPNQHWV